MQQPAKKIALAFLAHPDDAEILCAGTLIRLAALGWKVHLATATAGDCGTMTQNSWDIAALRTREAAQSATLLGAVYHCLDERDGFVVYDKPTLRKTYDLFRRVNPSLVFTHPSADYMMDHEQVSILARAASFVYGAPNISQVPLPPDAGVPWLYYCDPIEGIDPLGKPVTPTTLIDITSAHAKKLDLLACHASQREWLRAHHGMDEYLQSVRRHDADRGRLLGTAYAEGFIQHRGHAYPQSDLLSELL